jgi:hypothetical protein
MNPLRCCGATIVALVLTLAPGIAARPPGDVITVNSILQK